MLIKIKNRIETEAGHYLKNLEKKYSLKTLSPALFGHIKKILLQNGKRLPNL